MAVIFIFDHSQLKFSELQWKMKRYVLICIRLLSALISNLRMHWQRKLMTHSSCISPGIIYCYICEFYFLYLSSIGPSKCTSTVTDGKEEEEKNLSEKVLFTSL